MYESKLRHCHHMYSRASCSRNVIDLLCFERVYAAASRDWPTYPGGDADDGDDDDEEDDEENAEAEQRHVLRRKRQEVVVVRPLSHRHCSVRHARRLYTLLSRLVSARPIGSRQTWRLARQPAIVAADVHYLCCVLGK